MMDEPVVIAGAGPVGLSLALGLARHGVRSIVLESKPALSEHSKALGILARTLEILRVWRAVRPFCQEGTLLTRVPVHVVGRESPVAEIDLTGLKGHTKIPGVLILSQDRTESLLLELAKDTGMVDVRFGHNLEQFEACDSGVTVTVRPDSAGEYGIETGYLVGCDGPRSTVRTQLGGDLEGKTYPARMMLADIRLADERDSLKWPRIAPQARGVLAAIRFKPQYWRIISTLGANEIETAAISSPGVARRVERLFGEGGYESVWASTFSIHCRTSPQFRAGRVILAGDAAHINSPAGGQGMNSGIQDAHNLAWKLAYALKGGDADALITSYEEERREVVLKSVDRFTDLLTRFVLMGSPLIRIPFLIIARLALSIVPLRERILVRSQMLDTRYGKSSILSGEHSRIGARVPDVELYNGVVRRLYDLMGTSPALLLFGDALESRRSEGAFGVEFVRLDKTGAWSSGGWSSWSRPDLWAWFGARDGDIALIRPDHHVGWIAHRPPPEALRQGISSALGMQAASGSNV